ncbi:PspC domain-containing protein [Mucilaginibacter sp. HMF5004]|uniref:PspC domain-containing protein n=1 Tax=Mucilaginibacter rivuli TaxID=2857527 RepID=UPI001C6022BF|nr:PspC domain-containing protein [Mucilaginibacter rivuli]MBW4890985.1 PspC domain-containing protein [Mucilaginibacter rivuli]
MENRLYRDENRKVLGGVCAGLADYFNIDISLMRVIFIFANVCAGLSFWVYIVMWVVIPAKLTFTPGVNFANFNMPDPGTVPVPKERSASTATVIIGAILITFGTIFLLNEYDIMPDWEYHKLWPVVFIIIGLCVIFGSKKKTTPEQFEAFQAEQNAAAEQNETPENI